MSKISPTAAPAIANVATARMSGAPVSGMGRVEELSGSGALSFDAAQFGFQNAPDNSNLDDGRTLSDDRRRNPNLGRGRFSAPNETFARILEGQFDSARGAKSQDGHGKVFAGMVNKAISTYELNAQVIAGTLPRLGMALSMRL